LKNIRRLSPVLAALGLALLLALPASSGAAGYQAELPGPKPQLLLFHGGSFLFEDPEFEPLTRERAEIAGFVPHYVTYPLGDMPAAVETVRLAARELRERVGRDNVYAYGASAGGTLAAILAGEGSVAAAVAKAPVSDLVSWEWPLQQYGLNYFEQIQVGPEDRLRLSPYRRPQKRPLLVIQGRADKVVPLKMNEAFAAKFPRVHLWVVAGGHTTERVRPYLVSRAMRWLAQIDDRLHRPQQTEEADALP
jgi:acetyl esterase/lipase